MKMNPGIDGEHTNRESHRVQRRCPDEIAKSGRFVEDGRVLQTHGQSARRLPPYPRQPQADDSSRR